MAENGNIEEENKCIAAAMPIIMAAGDARNNAKASLDALMAGDEAKADELLKQAKEDLKKGHGAQTDLIWAEAQYEFNTGKTSEIPLLFIHAQDTIMSIMTEVKLTESMEQMYKQIMAKQADQPEA